MPEKNIFTLEVDSVFDLSPPSTTRVPLISQHAWLWRAGNKMQAWPPIVASPDPAPTRRTQLVNKPCMMSPVMVPIHSLAPVFATTHTSITRHASTSPRCPVTMAKANLGK